MLNIISGLCIEKLTRFLFNSNQIKNPYNEYAKTLRAYTFYLANMDHKGIAYKEQLTDPNNRGNSCRNQYRIEEVKSSFQKRAFYFSYIATYFTATSIAAISKGNKKKVKAVDKLSKVTFTNRLKSNGLKIIKLEIGFFLNSQQLKALYEAIQYNTELCYVAWRKDQHVNYPLIKKIETKIERGNRNCKNSGRYKEIYRNIREKTSKPSSYTNNLINRLLSARYAEETEVCW